MKDKLARHILIKILRDKRKSKLHKLISPNCRMCRELNRDLKRLQEDD